VNVADRIQYVWHNLRKSISRRQNRAWSGLSVLIIRDDHASTPSSFRINYYVLFFIGLILVSIPVMGLGMALRQFVRKTDQKRELTQRKSLLGSLQLMTEEKRDLMEGITAQIYKFERVMDSDQEVNLDDYLELRSQELNTPEEPATDAPGQILAGTHQERINAGLMLTDVAYHSLNRVWNRISIHHIMPRGRPLLSGNGNISSGFGPRPNPFGGDSGETHTGIDFAAAPGSPIIATAPGVVIQAVMVDRPGYGLYVMLHHGLGYTTLYGHCQKILVEHGQRVERGQVIALLGQTGRVTGPHVHYEVKLGGDEAIDPMVYVRLK